MSDQPPPGYGPAPGHPPGYGSGYGAGYGSGYGAGPGGPAGYPPGPAGGYGPAGWAPVHRPGVVALRPLGLGDCFDGAFKTIRRNPKAMVGLAALVTTAFLVLPALVGLALAAAGHLGSGPRSAPTSSSDPARAFTDAFSAGMGSGGYVVASVLGTLFGYLATVVISGMLVKVVSEAVLGREATIGQTWAAVRGRLLPLLGLTLLEGVVGVAVVSLPLLLGLAVGVSAGAVAGVAVGVLLFFPAVVLLVFLHVRFFLLAAPALVLERIGVVASLRRGSQLTRRQFWRTLGIYLLAALVAGIAGEVVAVPLGLLGRLGAVLWPGATGALVALFCSYLAQVLVAALTRPFTAGVVALQYVDQRIRKEGLDVQLIAAAQQPAGTP